MRPQTVPAAVGDERTTATQASVRCLSYSPSGSTVQTPLRTAKQQKNKTKHDSNTAVPIAVEQVHQRNRKEERWNKACTMASLPT